MPKSVFYVLLNFLFISIQMPIKSYAINNFINSINTQDEILIFCYNTIASHMYIDFFETMQSNIMRHYEKVRILLVSRLFGFPIIRNSHTNSALMHVNKERFETTEKIKMYRYTKERELYFFRFFNVCLIGRLSSENLSLLNHQKI